MRKAAVYTNHKQKKSIKISGLKEIHVAGLNKQWLVGLSLVLMLAVLGSLIKESAANSEAETTASAIYDEYYADFLKEYRRTLPEVQAQYYAEYYARFYSRYYSSPEDRLALQRLMAENGMKTAAYPVTSPVAHHATSEEGLYLIRYFEGFRAEPYKDAGGKPTIGYGHLLTEEAWYQKVNQQEAEWLLRRDVLKAEASVKRSVKVALTPAQFSALVSLVYNIGPGQFERSTLLKKLNSRNYAGAAEEFLRWDRVSGESLKGLKLRRERERQMFLASQRNV